MITSGSGGGFRVLSDAEMMIVLTEDRAVVMEGHYVTKYAVNFQQDQIGIGVDERGFERYVPGLRHVALDFSVMASGKVEILQGGNALRQFDLFRHFSVRDLLRQVNVKLNRRK